MSDREAEDIRDIINRTRHWNDGAGLIVSKPVADELRRLQIERGYSVDPGFIPLNNRSNEDE